MAEGAGPPRSGSRARPWAVPPLVSTAFSCWLGRGHFPLAMTQTKERWTRGQEVWSQAPALPCACRVMGGKLLDSSGPQVPHWKYDDDNIATGLV